MTRVWSEGFEMQDLLGYGTGSINTSIKRSGGASVFLDTGVKLTKQITAISEFYLRFGLYIKAMWTNGPLYIQWKSGSTVLGSIILNSSRVLYYSAGSGSGVTSAGTSILSTGVWYLIEIHVKIADSGNVDVKLDGNAEITYAGDTKPGAETTVDSIILNNGDFGGLSGSLEVLFDDIGLNDTAGGVDDSWCGDGRIIVIKPNGDTATLDLTPSAAVDHYTLVDDIPADGDTTYVEGSVDDEEDIYDLEACGLGDVIITRIWTEARAKDTASSGKNVALITKASGGAEVSGGDVALAGSYTVKVLGAEELVNPVDSAAWEVADIDALQGGPRTRP